ncbi:phosphate regulon sensor histidine kinase PhoR [Ramlibacter sp. 2FC]|uniref:phosphate regulon sensor histidine kinase PhoR n=1 Tax=Ramlibacter sp. 2FC TaxID=2502188 RepID=UPI0010F92C6F|nr:phosphate regulon sensor histidine kinase PhoR [Ramlibacter sp. 2FC]
MLTRFLVFALLQLAAGALGGWLAGWPGALAGAAGGGLVWFALDLTRGLRLIAWLRQADMAAAPEMRGLWGEAADRMRRLLRGHDQRVKESQHRLQEFLAAIQASPNGVVLLDAEGRIEWCNQIAAEHLGFDAQRDLLQHIGNLVREPAFAAYYAGRDYQHDVTIQGRAHSAARPVKLSVQLHPYGDGRKLLLTRDVTALAQAEAMRRDFVANVSHEIRTPLTVLSGFVETLQTLPLDEPERERYLQLMAAQAARMQNLVNDLLMLSRLEGSPPPGAAEWLPVAPLTAQCEEEARGLSAVLLAPQAPAQVLSFDAPRQLSLAGSAHELRSAVSNLINNAVRYTPAGGHIDVAWRLLPDGRLEFSVTDTGPGIAPEHLGRLSERFYRVDRSRSRESGGTGLGLAIAKHVAQRHGGELRIESQLGKGSRFTLLFPANRVRVEAPELMVASAGAG